MSKRLSEFLFDQDREATRDWNRTNHVTRAHNRRRDAREGFTALSIVAAFMALYVAAQGYTKAGVETRFLPETPHSESHAAR